MDSVINYDAFWYVIGTRKAFGSLSGMNFPEAYWKTAIIHMALGALKAQEEWVTSLEWDLDSNPVWQQRVAVILAEQFGLTKEEQDDCIHNFSFYSRTRSINAPVEKSEKERTNETLYEEEEEEDEEAYMVPVPRISDYSGHTAPITSLSWSPDGTYVVSGSEDGTAQIWESQTGKLSLTFNEHRESLKVVSWSPDGTYVVSGSEDGTVQIWESQTGRSHLIFNEHRESIKVVSWSPQGNLVASGGTDRVVRVWDPSTGEQIWEGVGHSAWICDLAWSSDGTRIASVALDKTVRVWDVSKKRLTHVLRGHEAVVTSVAWSPDGEHLVSGSGYPECLVCVWNARTGEREAINRWHMKDEKKVRPLSRWLWNESIDEEFRKPGTIHYLSWSPNGKQIVSAGERFVCHVWDAATGDEVMATHRTIGPVAWSSDGTTLFWLPNGAREVEVWDVTKNALKKIYQLNTERFISLFRISPDGKYVVADDETRIVVWKLK